MVQCLIKNTVLRNFTADYLLFKIFIYIYLYIYIYAFFPFGKQCSAIFCNTLSYLFYIVQVN